MVTTLTPQTWTELSDLLFKKDPASGKYRPYLAFRGLSQEYLRGELRTGIQRISDSTEKHFGRSADLPVVEQRLIDTFRNYAQEHHPELVSDWEVLALARHYRLCTRLIDWTMSPYVALFFATEDTNAWSADGVIWCANREAARDLLPPKLRTVLEERNTYVFTTRLLRKMFETLQDLDKDPLLKDAMIWFEPASISPRIVNQYAIFSVMQGVQTFQHLYFESNPGLAHRIIIPSRLKPDIHTRLQVMNLSHRTIYPGLDGIALWLNSYYA